MLQACQPVAWVAGLLLVCALASLTTLARAQSLSDLYYAADINVNFDANTLNTGDWVRRAKGSSARGYFVVSPLSRSVQIAAPWSSIEGIAWFHNGDRFDNGGEFMDLRNSGEVVASWGSTNNCTCAP